MQNTAVKAKQKYERKLAKAIAKGGGIELEYQGQGITAILIEELKGLYGVDDEGTLILIQSILQEVETGEVYAYNEEYGMMEFDFEFVGSREECYKYLLSVREANAQDAANIVLRREG